MANGMRQILLMLIPAAAAILVLAEPMTRLVYERGEFGPAQTDVVAEALFWFAFSLPLNGLFLIFTRTFFSLQRPWVPSVVSGINLAITAIASLALYSPFGVSGIVASTAIATGASVVAYAYVMRGVLHGIEFRRLLWSATRVIASAALLAAVSYLVWLGLDDALGTSVPAQIVSLGAALAAGSAVYFGAVVALRVPEADQVLRLLRRAGREV
jgi:putative peptidoglycan lipid II flippase